MIECPAMSKSARPSLEQARDVARLFGDARAVGDHPAVQRQIILDGSCRLVGADQGFLSEFDDFLPGRTPKGVSTIGSSDLDPHIATVTQDWYTEHVAEKDAMGAAIYDSAAQAGPRVV